MVNYVGEMTAKRSCKNGEYGYFEQLLFLFHNLLGFVCLVGVFLFCFVFFDGLVGDGWGGGVHLWVVCLRVCVFVLVI